MAPERGDCIGTWMCGGVPDCPGHPLYSGELPPSCTIPGSIALLRELEWRSAERFAYDCADCLEWQLAFDRWIPHPGQAVWLPILIGVA